MYAADYYTQAQDLEWPGVRAIGLGCVVISYGLTLSHRFVPKLLGILRGKKDVERLLSLSSA